MIELWQDASQKRKGLQWISQKYSIIGSKDITLEVMCVNRAWIRQGESIGAKPPPRPKNNRDYDDTEISYREIEEMREGDESSTEILHQAISIIKYNWA